jgi:hypothetical protein
MAARRIGTKYKNCVVPVTVFQVITGGALQKIGEFDNQVEASAAAGIPGQLQKNGLTACNVVRTQLQPDPLKEALQGHCLFFRGILLLYLRVPS